MDKQKLLELKIAVESFSSAVKEGEVRKRIEEIDKKSAQEADFWSQKGSKALLKEQSKYKKFLEEWERLKAALSDALTLEELLNEGEGEAEGELESALAALENKKSDFELKLVLSGDHDLNNAIVTIHAGAGGTESCDWAEMLLRMYDRFSEIEGFRYELLDCLYGEEAGIKSVVFNVAGEYAYGYLKGESGVHRLVRISPFDSQSRRHTSFASVFVLPEIDDELEVEVQETDLRIDTYRSSGAGGQHVNTTDSAVRLTHIPTGIVVACQTERSQHKNKSSAMKILRSKLYEYELEKRNAEKDKLEAAKTDIAWGNQIRSYVMHPYKMVKDLRTRYETGNVEAVMDGELIAFLKAYLLFKAGILKPAASNTEEE